MSLGPPIRKPPPEKPEWVPVEDRPGIERNTRTGQLRTNMPLPPPPPWPFIPCPIVIEID